MDILSAVAFLTTRLAKATEEGHGKLLGMLNYLLGISDIGLVLDCREGIALEVFTDASHAVHDDAKGRSGTTSRKGNARVCMLVLPKSSFEAELNSLLEVFP